MKLAEILRSESHNVVAVVVVRNADLFVVETNGM